MREGLGESHGTSVQASTPFCVGLDRTSCHWPLGQFGNFLKDAKQIRRRNRRSHLAGRFFLLDQFGGKFPAAGHYLALGPEHLAVEAAAAQQSKKGKSENSSPFGGYEQPGMAVLLIDVERDLHEVVI